MDEYLNNTETLDGIPRRERKVKQSDIVNAIQTLEQYKRGKANLEKKLIANEEFFKLRQWREINADRKDFKPATAWLWSCIQSRYSDAMDSYPTCNLRPREEADKEEARKLSSIIPVVLEQNRFMEKYSKFSWYTLKQGGGVYKIFWDAQKHNGLGDIAVSNIDFMNLFWEPGITDIQVSENLFHTELVNNNKLYDMYPQTRGKLGGKTVQVSKYLYDDTVDTKDKSVVVDWYYHRYAGAKKILHLCRFVNQIILYSSEDDPAFAERGIYDHGLYPFVCEPLFPIEGSLCGYGLTDIGRDAQISIDMLNKDILDNAHQSARPRYFKSANSSINDDEFLDPYCDVVNVEGGLDETHIRPMEQRALDSSYMSFMDRKIDELKQCTSNQDINNGITKNGVTAGSAIAALQEVAGKNARSSNMTFHRAYREVVYFVIELIRQFYNVPRVFRITGQDGTEEFTTYQNSGLVVQNQSLNGSFDMGVRKPEFDIEVTSEKASPYKKMENNELALQFYNLGFFNPQNADQALACLEMMDFDSKDDVVAQVERGQTLQTKLISYMEMAMKLAQRCGEADLANAIAEDALSMQGNALPKGKVADLDISAGEQHPLNVKARAAARATTAAE